MPVHESVAAFRVKMLLVREVCFCRAGIGFLAAAKRDSRALAPIKSTAVQAPSIPAHATFQAPAIQALCRIEDHRSGTRHTRSSTRDSTNRFMDSTRQGTIWGLRVAGAEIYQARRTRVLRVLGFPCVSQYGLLWFRKVAVSFVGPSRFRVKGCLNV